MERKEDGAQAPGICDRLFSFIINGIVFRGLKRVTLGRPVEDNTIASNTVGATKHTGESSIQNLSRKESLVERANKMYRSFPIATIGSSVQVQMGGEEEFFEVETPSPRMIPLGGEQNGARKGAAASPMNAQGMNSMRLQQSKPNDGKTAEITSQTVPAKDGAKQIGKKAPKKEKPVLENVVKVRSPTPMIPIISHAFDIDRRSDELIRRTREALRNSAQHS